MMISANDLSTVRCWKQFNRSGNQEGSGVLVSSPVRQTDRERERDCVPEALMNEHISLAEVLAQSRLNMQIVAQQQ